MTHHARDLCGEDDPVPIPFTKRYTKQQPLFTCRRCGLVYDGSIEMARKTYGRLRRLTPAGEDGFHRDTVNRLS